MPKQFRCHICSKVLTRSTVLRDHLRAHAGERPYSCPHPGCQTAFARRPDLLQHRKLHDGAPEHLCQYTDDRGVKRGCAASFHRKRDLERHRNRAGGAACRLRQISQIEPALNLDTSNGFDQSLEILEQTTSMQSTANLFFCLKLGCKERLPNVEAALLHQVGVHSRLGPFSCRSKSKQDPLPCSWVYYHPITLVWHWKSACHMSPSVSFVEDILEILAVVPSTAEIALADRLLKYGSGTMGSNKKQWSFSEAVNALVLDDLPGSILPETHVSAAGNAVKFWDGSSCDACKFDRLGRAYYQFLTEDQDMQQFRKILGFPGAMTDTAMTETDRDDFTQKVEGDTETRRLFANLTCFLRGFLRAMCVPKSPELQKVPDILEFLGTAWESYILKLPSLSLRL